ncbi:FAD-dependent monooxygenase [Streptomyces sp. BPTC-684]|uniref:FAD-dependent monooxygenase n=1 Tax=Streptomyces sp. BPTC-684 TaxID=3043734 RepID=UPI0024B1A57E|nr:FAD-dependent monooxygenase [Streptomyces sp. BPTC-684]WHM36493.1 FAD-dependent monooxygenase [Streptomyces sp. BPTC-684]
MSHGVIVVGAGPVGLMLAGELRLGGADVVVYDRLPAPSGESRGLGFTRRTAEVLDQRGLLERLKGARWGKQGHFGGVRVDFEQVADRHYGVMGLAQSRTEEMLGAWVAELGVTVRRGCRVIGLRQDDETVTVEFEGPDGRGEDSASYLVGCDGGRSTVRDLAGIGFPGLPATRGIYMADVVGAELPMNPIGKRVEGGGMVLSVTLGPGVSRIVIHEPDVPPHHGESEPTFQEVADAWKRMTGDSIHHGDATWMAALTNAQGQAEQYRSGRVFLAGDAAHDHAPLAAQGVSTGIQDAVNLGWKLAAALKGHAPEGLLDTYHGERHPVGQRLLRDTLAASLLYLGGEEMEPLRAVVRELAEIPEAARHLAGQVSGVDIRYDMGAALGTAHPLLGLRLSPDRRIAVDGTPRRAAELLRSARGVLITGPAAAEYEAAGWSDRVDTVRGTWLVDEDDSKPGTLPLPDTVLVRPDGYIAWTAPDGGDLRAALTRWFGEPAGA